jgi:hypothetical protein
MGCETGVLPWWGERWHKPLFIAFLLGCLLVFIARWITLPVDAIAVFLVITLCSTLATFGRQLPIQNVVIIAGFLGAASFAIALLMFRNLDQVSWRIVVLWTTIVVNAWGAAQFLARRWRTGRYYGWAILAIATTIAAVFAKMLYRGWGASGIVSLATIAVLLAGLPLFLNKRPIEPPVSWQPLVVLIALVAWLCLS